MAEKKRTWEDIPSLEGLEVDWDFIPKSPLGKRSFGRLTAKDLYPLFRQREFPVIVGFGNNTGNTSLLMDLSEGGMSLRSTSEFLTGQKLTVTFSLGNQEVIATGVVKLVREIEGVFFVGIQFTGLPKKNATYIKTLYSSAQIKR